MPQFTIDLPETILPVLLRKAASWGQTPEDFLSKYVVLCLKYDEQHAADSHNGIDDILVERDKGPFEHLPPDWKEQVMAKTVARIQQVREHI